MNNSGDVFAQARAAVLDRTRLLTGETSGENLRAFLAAYSHYVSTADPEGKERKLEDVTVRFERDEKCILVTFSPVLKVNEKYRDDIEACLPVPITCYISQKDYSLQHWNYNK